MDDEQPPAWFSESQRGDFKVGDEVVVTLGECRCGVFHGDQEHGVRGIVIGLDGRDVPDHPIWVCYRERLPVKGHGGYYTPDELRHFDWQAWLADLT